MTRNCEHYPETFPSHAVAVSDCGPDTDGGTVDVHSELRATEHAVAERCRSAIELGEPCDCIQVGGPPNNCGPTRIARRAVAWYGPTVTTLVAGPDALNGEIDQLASTAGDICTPAKTFLDLAWWYTENAIRQVTGECSVTCKASRFCVAATATTS
jgi:hypothetical protein